MQRILIVIIGTALVLALWLFTHHTSLGLAFRGIAQDERTALTLGIDTDWIATLSVSLGAGLAAFAATLIIPLGSIAPAEGYDAAWPEKPDEKALTRRLEVVIPAHALRKGVNVLAVLLRRAPGAEGDAQ